ncbi:MAG: 2-C-methyl-D-erythritol 4-phosphate cytidylyltransferase [Planctomycetes bacterium]|nr:2-C-methyl-D-erythritol 4-phosphate cytidylyltransferase [Planctomycetota bacterium]MBI3833334.1 2-C-methyl-D-erythritol 4-phosphate cytidylyltransferase [Planctomycetota bacterium]
MPKYSVIIAAAGKSERFGGAEKKTFAKIDNRPVFLRSLELFVTRPDVCQTILAVAPEDVTTIKNSHGPTLGFMRVQLVEGGARRCDTVMAALKAVSDDAEFVAVHDAARPCVAYDKIDAVFAEVVKSGAAILACPIVGTLKRVSQAGVIDATVSRESLYEAQTPQVFRKQILLDAYTKLPDSQKDAVTDDAQAAELAGISVSIVHCDASNLKITSAGDLTLAAAILKSRPIKPAPRMGAFEEAQW